MISFIRGARDLLLPKLISGDVNLEDLDIYMGYQGS